MSRSAVNGPVKLTASAHSESFPIPLNEVALDANSFLGAWQIHNARTTIPHLAKKLIETGALANLEDLNTTDFEFRGMWFSDSDIYKSLEALCWSLQVEPSNEQREFLDRATRAIASAQESDGYVNSYFQGVEKDQRWQNFGWGHELYTAGHLLQAAVAEARVLGSSQLMGIATKFADLMVAKFNSEETLKMCGHPEIETALIELFRETGNSSYLDLAEKMILGRGYGKIKNKKELGFLHFGGSYLQDHKPVLDARTAVGHSVRQLYLNAAVMDLYAEKGDPRLLEVQESMWEDMVYSKMYVTGGLGSRHKDESFGDSFELPNDRAYAETCASIANFMWSWRLLLATGKSRYADVMELSLYNIIAGSVSSDGCKFFYSNPLQYRTDHFTAFDTDASERLSWYVCSCCPPNIGRIIGSLQHYISSTTHNAIRLHLFSSENISTQLLSGANVSLSVTSNYPTDGLVKIKINEPGEYEIDLRVPNWNKSFKVMINGVSVDTKVNEKGYINLSQSWLAGDEISFDLQIEPQIVHPHPRIDASRGCVVIQRGPIIYAIEQADIDSADCLVDDFKININSKIDEVDLEIEGIGLIKALVLSGHFEKFQNQDKYAYQTQLSSLLSSEEKITAIPYANWGNRSKGGMRVWVPAQTK